MRYNYEKTYSVKTIEKNNKKRHDDKNMSHKLSKYFSVLSENCYNITNATKMPPTTTTLTTLVRPTLVDL